MANEKNKVIPKIFQEVVSYKEINLKSGDEILLFQKKAIGGLPQGKATFYFTKDRKNFFKTAHVASEEEFRQLMEKFSEAAGLDFKIEDAEGYANTLRCKFKGKGFFRRRNKS